MALVTGQTWEVKVPHEPGQAVTFRKLSFIELEEAAEIRKRSVFSDIRSMGADMATQLQRVEKSEKKGTEAPKETVREQYDKRTLLHKAIIGWTYSVDPTADNVDLLDEETAEWAYGEILAAHTLRTEPEKKAGSGASTAS